MLRRKVNATSFPGRCDRAGSLRRVPDRDWHLPWLVDGLGCLSGYTPDPNPAPLSLSLSLCWPARPGFGTCGITEGHGVF
jgi:hypothetical protein